VPVLKFQQVAISNNWPSLRDFNEPGDIGTTPGGIYDEDQIFISAEIWNALPTLDRAALVHHEFKYKEERWMGELTSEGTRTAVGLIFSKTEETVNSGLSPDQKIYITDKYGDNPIKRSDFRVTRTLSGVSLQFRSIMGRVLFAKTVAKINDINWKLSTTDGSRGCVVTEKGKKVISKVPLVSLQSRDWELEVSYLSDSPFKLSLYQNGIFVAEAHLDSCN